MCATQNCETYNLNKLRIRYFEQEDVLHMMIAEGPKTGSLKLNPNIQVELNDKNNLTGVEISKATAFLRDSVLESMQARTLQWLEAEAA